MQDEELREFADRRSGGFWFWLLAALLAASVVAFTLLQPGGRGGDFGIAGQSLTTIELTPLHGDAAPIGPQELEGRVSVLNFWGTWCPPCRAEFPHLLKLREKFQGRPEFQLLSVSCGTGRDSDLAELREETELFLNEQGAELPVYADRYAQTRVAVGNLLKASDFSYPTTLVLDAEAKIRGVWVGFQPGDQRQLEALVAKLLGE